MASGWMCIGCAKANPSPARFCAGCGIEHAGHEGDPPRAKSRTERARYLDPRPDDTHCRIHRVPLDTTGYCVHAQAWWVPKFRCPHCAGPLWDNGFCPTCTPRMRLFPGDYFEQRWEPGSGREWGHYVRVYAGPTPAPSDANIAGYLAELKALIPQVGRDIGQEPPRQPGEEPAWVTEG